MCEKQAMKHMEACKKKGVLMAFAIKADHMAGHNIATRLLGLGFFGL